MFKGGKIRPTSVVAGQWELENKRIYQSFAWLSSWKGENFSCISRGFHQIIYVQKAISSVHIIINQRATKEHFVHHSESYLIESAYVTKSV